MKWIVALVLIGVVAIGGPYYLLIVKNKSGAQSAAVHHHEPINVPYDHRISVLFIGNSYTLVNDLPHMLADVAASDSKDPFDIDVDMTAIGGATLDGLWRKSDARKKLMSQHWDFVILQEQSEWAVTDEGVHLAEDGMLEWSQDIARAVARPVIYETWARKPGSAWYNGAAKDHPDLISPDFMHLRLTAQTARLAKMFGAIEIPCGEFWALGLQQTPALPLYAEDGSHPSMMGTYLNALVFYRYLTGHSPLNVAYRPADVPQDMAHQLQILASRS